MSRAHQPPDVGSQIAALAREVEQLRTAVRRGKPAPHLRDLADANLTKAAGGQVPTYDAASGRWVPATPVGPGTPVSPASTVVAEQSFALSSAVGTSVAYARGDHTHGTPIVTSATVTNALGYTPVNKAGDSMSGTLTMNADITLNSNLNIGGKMYQSGLPGEITFETQGTFIQGDTYIFGALVVGSGNSVTAGNFASPGTPNNGAQLRTRSIPSHLVSFDWDGASFYILVDNILVRTL